MTSYLRENFRSKSCQARHGIRVCPLRLAEPIHGYTIYYVSVLQALDWGNRPQEHGSPAETNLSLLKSCLVPMRWQSTIASSRPKSKPIGAAQLVRPPGS